MKRIAYALGLLVLATGAQASPWHLTKASIGPVYVSQALGGTQTTGFVSWTPRYSINEWLEARGWLALLPLKTTSGGVAPALGYEAQLDWLVSRLVHAEIGIGAQSWIAYGGTALALEVGAAIPIRSEFLGGFGLERLVLSHRWLLSTNSTRQLALSFGFSFW